MQFFVDTADTNEIRDIAATGLVDGVTTNPSLVAKSGRNFFDVLKEITGLVKGPVSAEVTALDAPGMIEEGQKLARIAQNIVVKVPLTWEGLKACRAFKSRDIQVNVTLCFSAGQALLAAKAGATYVSPFVGRLDDIGENGMDLIADIKRVYDNYPALTTQILVASVRNVEHIKRAALIGAHVATVPPAILKELIKHPLTDKGLAQFTADWAKTGQRILGS